MVASGALLEGSVEGTRGPGLGLHLDNVGDLAEEVRDSGRGPVVGVLAHRRGRCDGVQRDDFREGIGHAGGGLVAIDADARGSSQSSVSPPPHEPLRSDDQHASCSGSTAAEQPVMIAGSFR